MPDQATILIADDQADNLLILEDLLSQSYHVKTAHDGQQALDRIAQGPPARPVVAGRGNARA